MVEQNLNSLTSCCQLLKLEILGYRFRNHTIKIHIKTVRYQTNLELIAYFFSFHVLTCRNTFFCHKYSHGTIVTSVFFQREDCPTSCHLWKFHLLLSAIKVMEYEFICQCTLKYVHQNPQKPAASWKVKAPQMIFMYLTSIVFVYFNTSKNSPDVPFHRAAGLLLQGSVCVKFSNFREKLHIPSMNPSPHPPPLPPRLGPRYLILREKTWYWRWSFRAKTAYSIPARLKIPSEFWALLKIQFWTLYWNKMASVLTPPWILLLN